MINAALAVAHVSAAVLACSHMQGLNIQGMYQHAC